MAGAFIVFLGLGMLGLGGYHAFEHGTCSTTGYATNYGPVPHCAKGIGWWAGTLILGIFVGLAGGAVIANRNGTNDPLSLVAAVLAGAIGVAGAFGMAAGINNIIGKVTTPSNTVVGSGVTTLSSAQIRANKVKVCMDLVVAQRVLSAGVKRSLTAQCPANPAAAERRLTVEAKAAALSYATAQCTKGVTGANGLPAAAQATLAAQCGTSVKSGGTASTAATAAKLCRQIVKAQVPAAAQAAALAACPKP